MTDLEKFVDLYKGFDIDCVVNKEDDGAQYICLEYNGTRTQDNECTYSDKFGGYYGFCSYVTFDEHGKFVRQSFVE